MRDQTHSILGVFAHADDAELWAGGTICAHRDCGAAVMVVCFDTGEPRRNVEFTRACNLLRIQGTLLPRKDHWWNGTSDDLVKIINLAIDQEPDIILTHALDDSHPEHSTVAAITTKAAVVAQDRLGREIHVYECSTYLGRTTIGLFLPTHFIDVSRYWPEKVAAISEYQSQNPATLQSFVDAQMRFFGSLSGVERAEGFRRYPLLGRGADAIARLPIPLHVA